MKAQIETLQPIYSKRRLATLSHLVCRLILAVIFGISSIQKVISPIDFENTLKAYHFNSVVIHLAIPIIPLVEFALALTLLFGIVMRTSAIISILLFGVYTILIGFNLVTGNTNHGCGCFIGISNSQSWVANLFGGDTITTADVIRDLVFISLAVVLWMTHDPKLGLDQFWMNSKEKSMKKRKQKKKKNQSSGQGYLIFTLILVFGFSIVLAVITEKNLISTTGTSATTTLSPIASLNKPLSVSQDFNPVGTITIGQKAPNFSLNTVDGKKYSLNTYRGKVVLLEFFAIWCSNCHTEAPIINQIQKKYPTSKLQILSVIASPYSKNYETSNEKDLTPYTAMDIKWYQETYHDRSPILIDPHFSVTNQYISQEYPNIIIIDQKGRTNEVYIGPTSFNVLNSNIQSLLSQKE